MFDINHLHCYGCAHSAATEPFPGKPSGERPCCFCVRNPNHGFEVKTWYNGSKPISLPMDCYHSLDMKDQMRQWEKENEEVDVAHLILKEAASYPKN